jgi:hypothetical protein
LSFDGLRSDELGVRPDHRHECFRLPANLLNSSQRVGNGIVMIAGLHVGDGQQMVQARPEIDGPSATTSSSPAGLWRRLGKQDTGCRDCQEQ